MNMQTMERTYTREKIQRCNARIDELLAQANINGVVKTQKETVEAAQNLEKEVNTQIAGFKNDDSQEEVEPKKEEQPVSVDEQTRLAEVMSQMQKMQQQVNQQQTQSQEQKLTPEILQEILQYGYQMGRQASYAEWQKQVKEQEEKEQETRKRIEKEEEEKAKASQQQSLKEELEFIRSGKMQVCGKAVDMKSYRHNVEASKIKGLNNSPENNYKVLRDYVTLDVREKFPTIRSIYVQDNRLIVNDVCYTITMEENIILPLDLKGSFNKDTNQIAPFFRWDTIRYTDELTVLSFDSADFIQKYVAKDLRMSHGVGVDTFFRVVPSLNLLYVNGDKIDREHKDTELSGRAKLKLKFATKKKQFLNGFNTTPYAITGGLLKWNIKNLKNYATNRGQKGVFRFSMGCIARAGLCGFGAVFHFVNYLFRNAFVPLSQEDLGNAVKEEKAKRKEEREKEEAKYQPKYTF